MQDFYDAMDRADALAEFRNHLRDCGVPMFAPLLGQTLGLTEGLERFSGLLEKFLNFFTQWADEQLAVKHQADEQSAT